jgi:cell division protein FtsB
MRTAAPSPALALRTARTPAGRRAVSPAARRRRVRLTVRASVLLTVVGGVLLLSVAPARMYFEQNAELAQLERQARILERENGALAARAEQLRDRDHLERLARQCLGMVKPGETAFVVVPKKGAPVPPPEC